MEVLNDKDGFCSMSLTEEDRKQLDDLYVFLKQDYNINYDNVASLYKFLCKQRDKKRQL